MKPSDERKHNIMDILRNCIYDQYPNCIDSEAMVNFGWDILASLINKKIMFDTELIAMEKQYTFLTPNAYTNHIFLSVTSFLMQLGYLTEKMFDTSTGNEVSRDEYRKLRISDDREKMEGIVLFWYIPLWESTAMELISKFKRSLTPTV